MRGALAVLALVGLIAGLGVTGITASGASPEAELRITAQLRADDRIEFALQQRQADGGWGDRLLPRARLFPPTATVGRWLSSTPLTVRSPGAGDDTAGTEVRITAQRRADGRTEFALQQREADGGWGDRLLPRARLFPPTATVGRWLSSTPLTVTLPEPEMSPDTADDAGSPPSSTATAASARDRDGDGLIEVDSLTQLDAIRWDLDGDGISDNADYTVAFSGTGTGTLCSVATCAGYELTANLDFDTNGNGEADAGDAYWHRGGGWIPIGDSSDPFATTFDGGGHTISHLYIRRTPNVGLFGVLGDASTVTGLRLVGVSVAASGYGSAGALAGIGHGVIRNSSSDGLVAGCVDQIGGLVGFNDGSIANSRSAARVASARRSSGSASGVITDAANDLVGFPLFGSRARTCYASGGGLVGGNSGTISSSYSSGVVSGFTDNFGGLAGVNSGIITDSYATGNVSSSGFTEGFAGVGGLVGENEIEGKIISSYAAGGVSGRGDNFGGLAGANSGIIAASYATGNVSGSGFADVGGLVGDNRYTGLITAVYATGSVSGSADRYGGLLGSNQGIVTTCFSTGQVPESGGGLVDTNGNYGAVDDCYWDTETSGQSDSAAGAGKTTAELQSPIGYTGAYGDWNAGSGRRWIK